MRAIERCERLQAQHLLESARELQAAGSPALAVLLSHGAVTGALGHGGAAAVAALRGLVCARCHALRADAAGAGAAGAGAAGGAAGAGTAAPVRADGKAACTVCGAGFSAGGAQARAARKRARARVSASASAGSAVHGGARGLAAGRLVLGEAAGGSSNTHSTRRDNGQARLEGFGAAAAAAAVAVAAAATSGGSGGSATGVGVGGARAAAAPTGAAAAGSAAAVLPLLGQKRSKPGHAVAPAAPVAAAPSSLFALLQPAAAPAPAPARHSFRRS